MVYLNSNICSSTFSHKVYWHQTMHDKLLEGECFVYDSNEGAKTLVKYWAL